MRARRGHLHRRPRDARKDALSVRSRSLPESYDCLAPDGSEIRLLAANERASMVHCTLPPGGVSLAVKHRTVEELWYCVSGRGELWRKLGDEEEVLALSPGMSADIPLGAHFQFRALGADPLELILTTIPPWPGDDEAVRVPDHWPSPQR